MPQTKPNRQIKDRLFVWLFGREENKQSILELYNALNDTHYTDPDAIEINTIENIVYLGMHNDVSFLLEGEFLSLWEEQSTFNPNMPVRGLMYLAQIYDTYITEHKLNLYGETRFTIPAPQYIVFYLGEKEEPDRKILKLSDSFPRDRKPDFEPCIEVTTTMLNVNVGHNKKLLDGCRALAEYSRLVQIIRKNMKSGMTAAEATEEAIDFCIHNDILSEILSKNRAEVIDMLLTEYDEKKTQEMFKEEGRREGLQEGRREGRQEGRKEGRQEGLKEGTLEAIKKLLEHGISVTSLYSMFGQEEVDQAKKMLK